MPDLTLPQIELIAAANTNRLWRHDGRDYTAGSNTTPDVTRRIGPLVDRGLVAPGRPRELGYLWQPTGEGRDAARLALGDLTARVQNARHDLGMEL